MPNMLSRLSLSIFIRNPASPCSLSIAVLILRLSVEPTDIKSSLDPWVEGGGVEVGYLVVQNVCEADLRE